MYIYIYIYIYIYSTCLVRAKQNGAKDSFGINSRVKQVVINAIATPSRHTAFDKLDTVTPYRFYKGIF